MNQIEIFNSPEFGSIRVIEENGKYLFCGADVAKSLGYKDTVNALKTHCREDGVAFYHLTDNLGRKQKAKFISEGNLYRLIAHSKLPSAERFEKWVFDEVLPTIRKHGSYLTKEKLWEVATSPEALLKLCSDLLADGNRTNPVHSGERLPQRRDEQQDRNPYKGMENGICQANRREENPQSAVSYTQRGSERSRADTKERLQYFAAGTAGTRTPQDAGYRTVTERAAG